MNQIPCDPDVREIVCITENLQDAYSTANQARNGSPFAWIKRLPSRVISIPSNKYYENYIYSYLFMFKCLS